MYKSMWKNTRTNYTGPQVTKGMYISMLRKTSATIKKRRMLKLRSAQILLCLFPLFALGGERQEVNRNYEQYHRQVVEAEMFIGEERFRNALEIYGNIFSTYDFIFLREYQVATQLALHLNEKEKGIRYLKKGITAGWELKSIRKNKYLARLRDDPEWKNIIESYDSLRREYEAGLNQQVREKVRKMFKRDQWKAIGALLRIGDKAQTRYAERIFAPHSEIQMAKLIGILETHGYPGEKLIGNDFWMSTILAHHNSISREYSKNDTLYKFIKPALIKAIKDGMMSPYEYAIVDDWHSAVLFGRTEAGYGFLSSPMQSTLTETNNLRKMIGLRTIETRNRLIDVEKSTGINLYLPGWTKGKIVVMQK